MATQGPATEKGAAKAKAARPAAARPARPSGGVFVGVDIGTYGIKAVEVKGYGAGLTVTGIGYMPTPPGAIQAGRVEDPKSLGTAIKTLLSKSGISGKKIVTSVAGADGVVVRVIEVPKMTPAELKEAMRYEVERSIPFPITDVEMDYQALNPAPDDSPENPNMEVLFAAAQRDIINRQLAMYQAAGQDVKAIDVEPLAFGRAIINLSRAGLDKKNVVVVNIGATFTEVGIFKDGVLRFPRTIPIAGENFTRAISDQTGLPMEQAEEEKKRSAAVLMDVVRAGGGVDFAAAEDPFPFGDFPTGDTTQNSTFGAGDTTEADTGSGDTTDRGVADPFAQADSMSGAPGDADTVPQPVPAVETPESRRRREIFDVIYPVLNEFAMEVRRSVDYFRSRFPADTVDQVILCGGSAKLAGLDAYINYETGLPTVVADPFAGLNVTARQMSTTTREEVAPAFAVALGLAVRDAVLGAGR